VPQVLEHPTSMRDLPPVERCLLVVSAEGRLQRLSELARIVSGPVAAAHEAEDARIAAPLSMTAFGSVSKVAV
jgi:hypothetical protein